MMVNNEQAELYWSLIKQIGSYNNKWDESIRVKSEIFHQIVTHYNPNAKTILFTSFNPIVIAFAHYYDVSVIASQSIKEIFNIDNVNFIDAFDTVYDTYDVVIALDEYLTYSDSEDSQKNNLSIIKGLTKSLFITTLQDYKNLAPHKKNQIDAIAINQNYNYIMLENTVADKLDKQSWKHYWYCLKDHFNLHTIGPVDRRTLYFKQLAKYVSDLGSKQYVVEKNLLYKGFFSKSFEHIIVVTF